MENEFINYIILLEETLADFYKNIKGESRYGKISPLFEFMETHSREHADLIREMNNNMKRPVIDFNMINSYQNNISKNVARQVNDEMDLVKVVAILADAEEKLGKLYDNFAGFVKELSDYYSEIYMAIQKVSKDEYSHRDLLLNDIKRLEKKGGK